MSGRGLGLGCALALLISWPQQALAQEGRDAPEPSAPEAAEESQGTPTPAAAEPAQEGRDEAAPPASEAETVIARRLNDSVAVRFAADGSERVLYFFDPRVELSAGDEVEQGPSGHTSVVLAEGGQLEMYASGHLIIHALGKRRGGEVVDELRFPLLTTAELTSGGRKIVCLLPGGTEAEFIDGRITVRVVPGRLSIRNEGGNPVLVRGQMTQEAASSVESGRGVLTLARGDEVGLPYFRQRTRRLGPADASWAGLTLRELGPLEVEHDAQRLVVTSHATEDNKAAFTVGGVRARIPAGTSMVFERLRRGAPSLLQGAGEPFDPGLVGGDDVAGAEASLNPSPPPGMTAITFDDYVTARRKGHSAEDLEALSFWVSPAVLAEYERLTADAGQMADDPASGEAPPSADDSAGDPPEEAAAEPDSDDGPAPAADEGSEPDDTAPEGEASDDPEDNR